MSAMHDRNKMMIFIFTALLIGVGCINTSYSRFDEEQITNDKGLIIIGAFLHHGDAFYEAELLRVSKILEEKPNDFETLNDKGAALTKLRRYEEALAVFNENEALHPKQYKTASNMGVLYKKMGEYELASEKIQKALEIQPSGHMNLGDYYLKMIDWLHMYSGKGEIDSAAANFLGVKYDAGPEETAKVANEEYVLTLIKNDFSFVDAYLVLGDIYFVKKDYELAVRAYFRGLALGSREKFRFDLTGSFYSRIDQLLLAAREVSQDGEIVDRGYIQTNCKDETMKATIWLSEVQDLEKQHILGGLPVDFASLKIAIKNNKIEEPKMLKLVNFKGRLKQTFESIMINVLISFLVLVMIIYLFKNFYKRRKSKKEGLS